MGQDCAIIMGNCSVLVLDFIGQGIKTGPVQDGSSGQQTWCVQDQSCAGIIDARHVVRCYC